MDDIHHKSMARRLTAGLLAGLLLLGLWGCNQQTEQPEQPDQADRTEGPAQPPDADSPDKDKPALPDHEGPLTKEEYEAVCQQYYDELMRASNEASLKLDEAVSAPAETEEQKKIRQSKMDLAMGLVAKMPPLYTRFIELEPPEIYAEAHELISSGAVSSGEVLRLTAAIAEAAKDESNMAEALVLQEELESHTAQAQNFSKGLRMVLGEQVGVGEDAK